MKSEAPIGVFDSGAGGLTILSALRRELSYEHYVYVGDTAHYPYGSRSELEVIELSQQVSRFLIAQGVKLIVVACNTASQTALSRLRATFPVPFVGVVPAVKPAVQLTKNGRIGIAATALTVQSAYLRQLIDEFAMGIQVSTIGCPELVDLVERGAFDGTKVEEVVRQALDPILKEDIDVIVLGCTQLPALRSTIERITHHQVQVIDSAAAIVGRTRAILETERIARLPQIDSMSIGELQVWCSGDPNAFGRVASKLLGYEVAVREARL